MNRIIDPETVRRLMAEMQPKEEPKPVKVSNKKAKAERAYEMITKTKCTLAAASKSWNVPIKEIISFAKSNNLDLVWSKDNLTKQAKELVRKKQFGDIKFGLKARAAYELALQVGVSEACRTIGVSRRNLYYYCLRYDLPTPIRVTGI